MDLYELEQRDGALVVSMPHVGTFVPDAIAARLTDHARTLPDTDWHLPRLYDFLEALGASVLRATHSRYVVDLNRPPDDVSLYPGQDTTGLVPVDTSEKRPLYRLQPPDGAEITERRDAYWRPYHEALARLLAAARARHGHALLWEAHSIKSILPRFFEGRLPDINIGTADGRACGEGIGERLVEIAQRDGRYTAVLNGLFKGGYITRHYGQPAAHVHAVQLELSWATYMDEDHPYAFREDMARGIRPVLRHMMEAFLELGAHRV